MGTQIEDGRKMYEVRKGEGEEEGDEKEGEEKEEESLEGW